LSTRARADPRLSPLGKLGHAPPMRAREVLDRTQAPGQQPLELAREAGHYVIRVGGIPLMSSATFGSEQAMARIAREQLGDLAAPRILVGGLGMGFTLRAVLDAFAPDLRVTVSELLPALVRYSRELLGHLADHPLRDSRVHLHQGDVRVAIDQGHWHAILLDVDNGPAALTTRSNRSLYHRDGLKRIRDALEPGGVLVVWSAFPSQEFETNLRRAGLACQVERVRARGKIRKGPIHTLFVARAPV
jgi:spermidine synthase